MNETRLTDGGLRLRPHAVHLDNREALSVTGVIDVASFNDAEVILSTDGGGLTVEGEELKVTKLDLDDGQVTVEGRISAIVYDEDVPERKGLFKRMFR
ncbi:MAG: sporulation protein YabP [Clostridia bacterium]|nr:sporulation protein YabP [Clostridia bacterium]